MDIKKKVVLITGCSSGIGLSLAVRLASDPDKTYKGNTNQRLSLVSVFDFVLTIFLWGCQKSTPQ